MCGHPQDLHVLTHSFPTRRSSDLVGGATIQAVADAAGVTKGGLLHHFPSKQILIEALFADLLEQLDAQLDAQLEGELEGDARSYGRFTRAYVRAMTRLSEEASNGVWTALTLAMQSEKPLRALWSGWLEARLRRHAKTRSEEHTSELQSLMRISYAV